MMENEREEMRRTFAEAASRAGAEAAAAQSAVMKFWGAVGSVLCCLGYLIF